MSGARGSIRIGVSLLGLLLLGGCVASVPMADNSADADAKKFQPEAGKASIYICRGAGIAGNLLIQTQVDGLQVGALAWNTYSLISVAPGHHVVAVSGPTNEEELPVDAVAGSNYFFQVSMIWAGPGIRHRHIEVMTDADGRQYVNGETRATAINP
jgi:hypothetical protein